jgi:hypothetical protein
MNNVEVPMYKVTYHITGTSAVLFKVFDTFQEAMLFSSSVPTGNVLEVKRLENES